jgi:uncharacterized protein
LLPDERVKILFSEICKAGNRYEITDDSWFADTDLQPVAPVQAVLTLHRQGDSRVELAGSLQTGVRLSCDRCLVGYEFAVNVRFHLILEVPSDTSWQVRELECSGADLDTVLLLEPVVDIPDILRQQLLLSLPEKQICVRNCRGLCPQCGNNLNRDDCSCVAEQKTSPFAVLASLQKK